MAVRLSLHRGVPLHRDARRTEGDREDEGAVGRLPVQPQGDEGFPPHDTACYMVCRPPGGDVGLAYLAGAAYEGVQHLPGCGGAVVRERVPAFAV